MCCFIKYILDFEDLVRKQECEISHYNLKNLLHIEMTFSLDPLDLLG